MLRGPKSNRGIRAFPAFDIGVSLRYHFLAAGTGRNAGFPFRGLLLVSTGGAH